MPHIDSTKFGEITIDGRHYRQVTIIGSAVKEREYERLTKLFGTSHRIGAWETDALLSGDPEAIVVGTGQDGVLKVGPDLVERAKAKGIEVISALTPEAVNIYNRKVAEGRRVNALIHTTC